MHSQCALPLHPHWATHINFQLYSWASHLTARLAPFPRCHLHFCLSHKNTYCSQAEHILLEDRLFARQPASVFRQHFKEHMTATGAKAVHELSFSLHSNLRRWVEGLLSLRDGGWKHMKFLPLVHGPWGDRILLHGCSWWLCCQPFSSHETEGKNPRALSGYRLLSKS